jgi:hypothetical protein
MSLVMVFGSTIVSQCHQVVRSTSSGVSQVCEVIFSTCATQSSPESSFTGSHA